MARFGRLARAVAVFMPTLGVATASFAVEPLQVALGERWSLSIAGVSQPMGSSGVGGFNARIDPMSWHLRDGWAQQALPASQLTVQFSGGSASLTRRPAADPRRFDWERAHLGSFGIEPSVWRGEDEPIRDVKLARDRLRQAIVGILRAAGGTDGTSMLEIGTSTTHQGLVRLPPFPDGKGFSRSVGLDQISLRLTSTGDGHVVLGRKLGRDAYLALEPGVGGSKGRARLHYRLATWAEMRFQAGDSQVVQLVTVLPLN